MDKSTFNPVYPGKHLPHQGIFGKADKKGAGFAERGNFAEKSEKVPSVNERAATSCSSISEHVVSGLSVTDFKEPPKISVSVSAM